MVSINTASLHLQLPCSCLTCHLYNRLPSLELRQPPGAQMLFLLQLMHDIRRPSSQNQALEPHAHKRQPCPRQQTVLWMQRRRQAPADLSQV